MTPGEWQTVLLVGLINPFALLAGFTVGYRADQVQKVLISGFAGGIAGFVAAFLLAKLGIITLLPRSFAGVFVTSFAAGLIAGAVGYALRRP